jgi:hypothetical protein
MVTKREKLDAANAALDALGVDDPDEAARFVALYRSQVPLLPQPEPAERAAPAEELLWGRAPRAI